MSSYPNEKTPESGSQSPPPHYDFVQSAESTPAPQGAYIYVQSQHGGYKQQGVTYPQVVAVTNIRAPNSFLAWSIVSLIFFCLPLGIAALVCSFGASTDFALGLHDEARRKSAVARSLNIAATVLGIVMWVIVGVWFGLALNASNIVYANVRYYSAN